MNRLKNMFALSDQGTKGLIVASFTSFLSYFAFMAPIVIILLFVEALIERRVEPAYFYIIGIVITAIIMYIIININYKKLYGETYKESKNLRVEIANILKSLPLSYFSKHNVSDLSQTIMQDVADIEHAMAHAIPETIGMIFFLIVIGVMMLAGNFVLGLCILIPIGISCIMIIISKKMQVRSTTKYFHVLRENSESFQEAIELQQEIKSYGRIQRVKNKLNNDMEHTEKVHIKVELAQAVPTALSNTLLNFTVGATIVFGAILYLRSDVSLLYFLGYLIGANRIIDGVTGLYFNLDELLYLDARIARIKELRQTKIQEGEQVELHSYDICFDHVSFSYHEDVKVINDISFVAKQNEVTALVGPSGCGKTTILRLMSRLYDCDTGTISIDQKDMKNIHTDSLFEKVSIVFQDVTLFNTSILENIRIGNKDASDEEVKEAAKLAHCDEFINKLPKGYETHIGENGSALSGGERQRLSIARAILKNAPIIILDEISASLDVENEKKIQESLNTLIQNKTVVIISHRLKSIEHADKIVVLNEGSIDAMGTHQQLLNTSKLYNRMITKSTLTENYKY